MEKIRVSQRVGRKIVTKSPSTHIIRGSVLRVCQVCCASASKYTCPRCNIQYCTPNCYKSHGEQCTESFYRELIQQELKVEGNDPAQLKEFKSLLHRVEQQQRKESDSMLEPANNQEEIDPGCGLLEERLQELSLQGDKLTLESLSDEERRMFLRAVASGSLSELAAPQPWRPWWTSQFSQHMTDFDTTGSDSTLISSVDLLEINIDEEGSEASTPPFPCCARVPIRPFSEISSKPAAESVRFNMLELVFAYCRTMLLYNGEPGTDPAEAGYCLLAASSVLCDDARYESAGAALRGAVERCHRADAAEGGGSASSYATATAAHVATLVGGGGDESEVVMQRKQKSKGSGGAEAGHYVCDALLHAAAILDAAAEEVNTDLSSAKQTTGGADSTSVAARAAAASDKTRRRALKSELTRLRRAAKKVEWYSSWAGVGKAAMWNALGLEVGMEARLLRARAEEIASAQQSSDEQQVELNVSQPGASPLSVGGSSPLIQEI